MDGSRVRVALLLLLVFAAGLAGGVAAERLWLSDDDGRHGRDGPVIQRHADELDLTERQRARVDSIVSGFRGRMRDVWSEMEPRFRQIADSARDEIEGVLDEEQVERYRELLEREREKHDHRGKDPGDSTTRHSRDSMTSDRDGSS